MNRFQRAWNFLFTEEPEVKFAFVLRTSRDPEYYLEFTFVRERGQDALRFNIKDAVEPQIKDAAEFSIDDEETRDRLTPEQMLEFDRIQEQFHPGNIGIESTYDFLLQMILSADRVTRNAVERQNLPEGWQAPMQFLTTLKEHLEDLKDAFADAREE